LQDIERNLLVVVLEFAKRPKRARSAGSGWLAIQLPQAYW